MQHFSPTLKLPETLPSPPASRKEALDMLGQQPHGRHMIRVVYIDQENGKKYWQSFDTLSELGEFLDEGGTSVQYLYWYGDYSEFNTEFYREAVGDSLIRIAGEILTIDYRKWEDGEWVYYQVRACVREYDNVYDLIRNDMILIDNINLRRDYQFHLQRHEAIKASKVTRFGGMRTPRGAYQFRDMSGGTRPHGSKVKADLHITRVTR